ncbi:hypothetical protein ACFQ34_11315 [Pseudonocardia benzenivorans]|uniref:Chaplin domain-containing protein n=2 Tax=Pseudonocardia TaxID=1847 RepID=F4CIY3_PSEUX|nr:hypothetical protein [Pseudonocardia dioxanivorans]AEA23203.1 hypothetical protein Psed_0951 [Pseudonocardia dioxanivorans CB1190]GJF03390.1 hypothetical protein PSD17_23500 [Pseudonocardia sp. D17]
MLKKAGIVAATATAGLLAVSPLAFAGDAGWGGHHHGGADQVNSNKEIHQGLVNVSDNNINVPVTACGNDIPVNVLGVQVSDVTADLTGALGLLGPAGAKSVADQSQDRSCAVAAAAGNDKSQSNDD